ncbi:unnamed protein product, partial [Ectocarpus sp. 8 AP-2014]
EARQGAEKAYLICCCSLVWLCLWPSNGMSPSGRGWLERREPVYLEVVEVEKYFVGLRCLLVLAVTKELYSVCLFSRELSGQVSRQACCLKPGVPRLSDWVCLVCFPFCTIRSRMGRCFHW